MLVDDIEMWVLGSWVEHGASHSALELTEWAKWGKEDVFDFGQVEFEMSEYKASESDLKPAWSLGNGCDLETNV